MAGDTMCQVQRAPLREDSLHQCSRGLTIDDVSINKVRIPAVYMSRIFLECIWSPVRSCYPAQFFPLVWKELAGNLQFQLSYSALKRTCKC